MTVSAGRKKGVTMSIDADGHTQYVVTWDVPVTSVDDTPNDVSTASGVALFGDAFTWGAGGNPDAFCCGKNVSNIHEEGTQLWRQVTATFSTKPGTRARGSNNVSADPRAEPWKKGGSFVLGTRVTSIDKDGAPIVTTGKERKYFDVPDGYDTLHLSGPSATMSYSQRAQAIGRCNSATIWGLTTRKVYMAQWQWEEQFHGDESYFYHQLEFWIKFSGWNEVWLNEGTQEYVSTNPVGKRIVPIIAANDSGGRQTRFLDANGRILPETSIPASVITNTTKAITEFDFTALTGSIGLPDPLPGNFV
jgi:hypothetical protein